MNPIKSFFNQSSWYIGALVATNIIGLVSFPIWTRVFTVEEYGILRYIAAVTGFVGSVSYFGLHKSAMRFLPEFESGKRNLPMASLYTTLVLGSFLIGAAVGTLFIGVIVVLGPERLGGYKIFWFFILSGVMLFLKPMRNVFTAFLRAEQKAKVHSFIRIIMGYVNFGLSILTVIVLAWGLWGLYVTSIVLGIVILVFFWRFFASQNKLILSTFSWSFLVESLHFGFPLISAEIANTLSAIGDRYVLQFFLGYAAVGIYSVGYGFTTRVVSFLSMMLFALMPVYLKTWEEQGREKTEKFLSNILDLYLMIALPAIIFFSFFGSEVITLLASAKYTESSVVLPYLFAPLVLHGGISIYAAGLYIHKKTKLILYFTLSSGILNIILNIILVPFMGMKGAALATLISYTFLIALSNIFSSKYLTIQINYLGVLKSILASLVAVVSMRFIHFEIFLGIVFKLAIGGVIYSGIMLIIDQRIRDKVKEILKFEIFSGKRIRTNLWS